MAIIGCECMICSKFIKGKGMTPPFPICDDCLGTLKEIVAERKSEQLDKDTNVRSKEPYFVTETGCEFYAKE